MKTFRLRCKKLCAVVLMIVTAFGSSDFLLELTWMRDQKEPYNLGDEEFHLALTADDFDKAHALHEKMECICFENHDMGIYFINDPDGYWIEIIPAK